MRLTQVVEILIHKILEQEFQINAFADVQHARLVTPHFNDYTFNFAQFASGSARLVLLSTSSYLQISSSVSVSAFLLKLTH